MSHTFTLNDGVQIPWLGFGTGTALYTKDSAEAVKAAIQTGITHLDESLGQGIKESGVPREQLFVTTKLEETPSAPTIKATLETSLKKLGLDYVDLFLIHSPFVAMKDGKLKEWWKEMEEIKKEGLAKSIGVSNFAVEHLQIILEDATVVPAVNQIELHPYITAAKVYDFCQEKGIVVESYGALSSLFRVPGGPVDPVIASAVQRLSNESGTSVSPGQVLMKWLIQKRVVIVSTKCWPLPSLPDLTLEEIAAIETEGSKMHKRFFISRAE
ncbi:oxidoreductase [Lentinula aff. detonsa]|uniref:Oxidoreductase n=1 Tax=Lentinula aff. detonsa TaxID=2804958 RepID=A0AA38KR62_9AGAR|nr:oxidoreductase [Lentinula aff. detonsa]